MFIDLETERLFLKCIGYDDTEFFYKQFTTDEVNQYLFDIEPFDSMEEAQKWIGFYLESEPRNQQRWIMVLKENGEKIGTCGFHRWNRETGEIEVGYDLQPSHPGAEAGPKGWAVRPLKRHASWVQNVVRQFGPYPPWAQEI
jgi:ribosomal-protein-alanine N-acetyltransferase